MEQMVLESVQVQHRTQTLPVQSLWTATSRAEIKRPKCFTAQTQVFISQLFQIWDYSFDTVEQNPC